MWSFFKIIIVIVVLVIIAETVWEHFFETLPKFCAWKFSNSQFLLWQEDTAAKNLSQFVHIGCFIVGAAQFVCFFLVSRSCKNVPQGFFFLDPF